jgi:peroxiredoxin
VTALTPRKPVPGLVVSTLTGETWNLAERTPKNFTMIVFYRGLHCPICSNYMRDLDRKLGDFEAQGVEVIAISTDDEERSRQTKEGWGLEKIAIGHGLSIEKAREWGLYISSSRGKTSAGIEEPPLFNEPGLFLVRPDGTLYAALVGSMPFARPHFSEVLKALEFILAKDYPGRGEA